MAQLTQKKSNELIERMDAVVSEFQSKTGIEETKETLQNVEFEVSKEPDPLEWLSKKDEEKEIKKFETKSTVEQTSSVIKTETHQTAVRESNIKSERNIKNILNEKQSTSELNNAQTYVAIVESHVYTNKDAIIADNTTQHSETIIKQSMEDICKSSEETAFEHMEVKEEAEISLEEAIAKSNIALVTCEPVDIKEESDIKIGLNLSNQMSNVILVNNTSDIHKSFDVANTKMEQIFCENISDVEEKNELSCIRDERNISQSVILRDSQSEITNLEKTHIHNLEEVEKMAAEYYDNQQNLDLHINRSEQICSENATELKNKDALKCMKDETYISHSVIVANNRSEVTNSKEHQIQNLKEVENIAAAYQTECTQEIVQESSFIAKSVNTLNEINENKRKLSLNLTKNEDYTKEKLESQMSIISDASSTDIKTPTPSTIPPTPLTDEYVFRLEIPLAVSSAGNPDTIDEIPDIENDDHEDPHIVKKKLIPHIDTTIESIIYDEPLATPLANNITPAFIQHGLDTTMEKVETKVTSEEEILEIERKSSLLATAIDETIKIIEEYKEQVGLDTLLSKEINSNNEKISNDVVNSLDIQNNYKDSTAVKNNYKNNSITEIKENSQNNLLTYQAIAELKQSTVGTNESNVESMLAVQNNIAVVQNDITTQSNIETNSIDSSVLRNIANATTNDLLAQSDLVITQNNTSFVQNDFEAKQNNISLIQNEIETTRSDFASTQNGFENVTQSDFSTKQNSLVMAENNYSTTQNDVCFTQNNFTLQNDLNTMNQSGFMGKSNKTEAITNGNGTNSYHEEKYSIEQFSSEIGGTNEGIMNTMEGSTVLGAEVAKELGKPGMTEDKIAELISGESEMLREAHVMGLKRVLASHMNRPDDSSVDFKKIKPIIENLKDSEVLKALNEEIIKTRDERLKEKGKMTTFLQKPKRPVPKAKFGYCFRLTQEAENEQQEPYKVKIVKQPKPKVAPDYIPEVEDFETGPLPWEERAAKEPPPPPVPREDPILVPEEVPEYLEAVDPLPESEVPDLEDTGIPLPLHKKEIPAPQQPKEPAQETEEVLAEIPTESNAEEVAGVKEEESKEDMEQARIAQEILGTVQNMVDPNATLEQQLGQMRAQLAALAQLPGVIQQTLELVTKQLTTLSTQEVSQSGSSQETVVQSSEHVEVTEEQFQNTEVSVQETEQKTEISEQVNTEQVQTEMKVEATSEELEKIRAEEIMLMEEQRRVEKEKKVTVRKRISTIRPEIENWNKIWPWGNRKSYCRIYRINFMKYEKPPVSLDHLKDSDVYKLVHNMDEGPVRRVDMLTPVIAECDYREKCRSVTPSAERMKKEQVYP